MLEMKRRMELKHIQNVLTLNGYPNWLLNRKLKIKLDPLFATPAACNAVKTRGIAILPYVPNLLEKLNLILLSHGIRTVFKPPQKLGGLLSSFKDAMEPAYRLWAIYKINYRDCNQFYIDETKRWFETRKKEHMREVKNSDNSATALSKHAVELGHSIDWKNYEILQIETDYHKRKFIESFYITSLSDVLMIKNPFVFHLYTKICFYNIIISIF